MDLTAEQQTIIEADASDLAVSAGAGSGKTRVLVERYVQLLRDCSIPEIAAITFTEAAAAEMRDRVRREVMSDPSLEPHRVLLDEAAIGTVHSLGLRLLREHPVEAGLDPSAAVLADDEAELLRRAACIEAIDAARRGRRRAHPRAARARRLPRRPPAPAHGRAAGRRRGPPSRRWVSAASAGPRTCAAASTITTGLGRGRSADRPRRSPGRSGATPAT